MLILPKTPPWAWRFSVNRKCYSSEVFFFRNYNADLENRFHGQFHMWNNGVGLDVAEIHSGKHQQKKVAFHTWLLMALNKSVHTHLSRYHEKMAPTKNPLQNLVTNRQG